MVGSLWWKNYIKRGGGGLWFYWSALFCDVISRKGYRRTCQVQKKIMPLASNCMKFGYISYNTINQSWKINTISQKIYCFLFLAKMYWKYTKNLTTPKKVNYTFFFILCSLNFVTYNLHNLRLAHWKRELKYIYLVVACFTESLIIF